MVRIRINKNQLEYSTCIQSRSKVKFTNRLFGSLKANSNRLTQNIVHV